MNRFCFLLLLFVATSSTAAYAQSSSKIRGKLIDQSDLLPLEHGVLMVLQAQDSILLDYTRANKEGLFELPILPAGDYILWASYPNYADYIEKFTIDSTAGSYNFETVGMTLKARLLEAVLISGIEAVKIKGDTTEFDPRAFVIEPNSKVEDLIRQFPGIQVDANGQITAHGKRVTKVLVDGEEFFGDDPTLVTKNLRGDMIQKVQLYDKKSDQAEFTGVDDGERTTTLNMVLKEDKKKGYFGKIDGGLGTNDMYASQGMFNRFNNKQRIAAYGTIGNTGRTGLNFSDAQTYGAGSSNVQIMEGGGISISSGSGGDQLESFDGRYNGRGIPEVISGGVHFGNKWNQDKHNFNGSYKLGQLGVTGTAGIISQNLLPTGTIHNQSDQIFDNFMLRHKADAIYDFQIDSTSSLKVTVSANSNRGETFDSNTSLSRNDQMNMLNDGFRKSSNETRNEGLTTTLFWRKRMKKTGRTMSWDLNHSYSENTADGFLYSKNQFYDQAGLVDSMQIIDQKKLSTNTGSKLGSSISYTEPLTKTLSLVLNYALNFQNGVNHLQSLNPLGDGQYGALDSLFSNNFKLNQLSNQAGATLSYRKDKHTVNLGGQVSNVSYNQKDRYTDYDFSRSFYNFSPRLYWTYRPKANANLSLNYYGSNQQPSINQLQPVLVNTDPLNLYVGNLSLKPSFSHSVSFNYYEYQVLKSRGINASGSVSMTQDPIVMDRITDSVGRSIMRSVNLFGQNNMNYYLYTSFNHVVSPMKINISYGLNYQGSAFNSLVNSEINTMNSHNVGLSLSVNKYELKKYTLSLGFTPNYNASVSSLQRQQNNSGWGYRSNFRGTVHLPGKLVFGANGNYQYTAPTQAFAEDFRLFILNATLERNFFKNESLKLQLSANDILNQNQGFSRSASTNVISQSQHTTIRRYYMVMLTWDFNQMGGAKPASSSIIEF